MNAVPMSEHSTTSSPSDAQRWASKYPTKNSISLHRSIDRVRIEGTRKDAIRCMHVCIPNHHNRGCWWLVPGPWSQPDKLLPGWEGVSCQLIIGPAGKKYMQPSEKSKQPIFFFWLGRPREKRKEGEGKEKKRTVKKKKKNRRKGKTSRNFWGYYLATWLVAKTRVCIGTYPIGISVVLEWLLFLLSFFLPLSFSPSSLPLHSSSSILHLALFFFPVVRLFLRFSSRLFHLFFISSSSLLLLFFLFHLFYFYFFIDLTIAFYVCLFLPDSYQHKKELYASKK